MTNCKVNDCQANLLRGEIKKLRAALEPFQKNIESESLSGALGHIQREHLEAARAAFMYHDESGG